MSILVFAAKRVGYECLYNLVMGGHPVSKVIVPAGDESMNLASGGTFGAELVDYSPEIQDELAEQERDWILNFWSPYILKKNLLDSAKHRLNIHPSLVPFRRGMDQAAWTIIEGGVAGVSLIEMEEGIDTGGVWSSKEVDYPDHWTGKQLHQLLEQESINLFRSNWKRIYNGEIKLKGQMSVTDDGRNPGTYHTRRGTNQNRTLPSFVFNESFMEHIRWMLAHNFFPRTMAEVEIHGKSYGLNLELVPLKKVKK